MTYLYENSGIWDIKDRAEVQTPPAGISDVQYQQWCRRVPKPVLGRMMRAVQTLKIVDTIRMWSEDGS